MNKYETLKCHMNMALKDGQKLRRLTLADIVATIDKAATAGKTRVEITDAFVEDILIKYQKIVQEMVDNCPDTEQYANRKAEYLAKLEIVKEYAPQLVTDETAIMGTILTILQFKDEVALLEKKNKGQIMRVVMPAIKGQVDMAVANKVIDEMLKRKVVG